MIAIDLHRNRPDLETLLELASKDEVFLRTAEGQEFVLAQVGDEDDDFAAEVERTAQNEELMAFLAERSTQRKGSSLAEVQARLGLTDQELG